METVAAAMVRSNAHRIAVVDRTGEMEGLISESTIIRWAAEACKDLEVCKKTVADLGLAPKDVLSVDINADAIVAFCKIVEQDVSGLAVVDDAGKLVANISASDLKVRGWWARMAVMSVLTPPTAPRIQRVHVRQPLHASCRLPRALRQ